MYKTYLFLIPVALSSVEPSWEMISSLPPNARDPFYLNSSFLYWSINRSFTVYGSDKNYEVPFASEAPFTVGGGANGFQGTFQTYSWGWNPGVRIEGGYLFEKTPWFIDGSWTELFAKKGKTFDLVPGPFSYLNPIGASYIVAQTGTPTSASWVTRFHYNTAHLSFGLGWKATESLLLQFKLGPAALWLVDRLKVTWLGTPAQNQERTVWNRSIHFSGGGAMLNATALFMLGKGLSLSPRGTISGFYGDHRYKYFAGIPTQPTQQQINIVDIASHNLQTALFQAGFGTDLNWQWQTASLSCEIGVGYEFNALTNFYHEYFPNNQGNNVAFSNMPHTVDEVYLHGWTFHIGFGF
jgi:hypothetical protein